MKTSLSIFVLCAFSTVLFGQKNTHGTIHDFDLTGSVKSLSYDEFTVASGDGFDDIIMSDDDIGNDHIRVDFDKAGNVVKHTSLKGGTATDIKVYEYNEKGQLVSKKEYGASDDYLFTAEGEEQTDTLGGCFLGTHSTFKYDLKSNSTIETVYWSPEVLDHIITYSYNSEAQLVSYVSTNEKKEITEKITYSYDSNGNMTEVKTDNSIEMNQKLEYNNKNQLSKKTTFYDDGKEAQTYNYSYDVNGRITQEGAYGYVYKDDDKGNWIGQIMSYDIPSMLIKRTIKYH